MCCSRPDGGNGKAQTSPISYTRDHPLKKAQESPKSPDFVPAFMEPQFSPPASKPVERSHSQDSGAGERRGTAQKYEPPQRRWAKERQRMASGSSAGGDQEHVGDYRDYLAKEVVKGSWDGDNGGEWNVKGPNPANQPWDEDPSTSAAPKKQGYDKAAQEWKENMRIDEPIVIKSESPRQKTIPQQSPPQNWNNRPRGRSSPPPRFRQQHSESEEAMEYEGGSPRGGYGGYRGGFRDSTAPSGSRERGEYRGERGEYRGNGDRGYHRSNSNTSKDWRGDRERKVSVESPPVRSGFSDSPPAFNRRVSSDEPAREPEYDKPRAESKDSYKEPERQSSVSAQRSSTTEVRKANEENKPADNTDQEKDITAG